MPRKFVVAAIISLLFCTACASTTDASIEPAATAVATIASEAPATATPEPVATTAQDPTPESPQDAPLEVPEFAPLNPAVGFGFLRVMTLEERPHPLDVVIYATLPNELPRVAGVITEVSQTPLSHVNLRAVQDNVPNAWIKSALTNPDVLKHLDSYVKYTVTGEGFTIEPATQAEVESHHTDARPAEAQTPQRDLSVTAVTALGDISFEDWPAFGVKAANLATLGQLDLPDAWIPDGFAVPFSFYDEFMETNGFYEEVEAMLADPAFREDAAIQEARLTELRADIRTAPMSTEARAALDELQQSFPTGTSLRCRSSTNNEDLPGFSGAGLYDSRTQHPDEGHMSKCIKQVYASVWNFRAFLARDFYRVDHLSTAMGVLVHPNFKDELINGAAASFDPVFNEPDVYYFNTQLGEDLVTNPEANSVPEALLVDSDGAVWSVITYSNLGEPRELLMSDEDIASLQSSLRIITDAFAELYEHDGQSPFAMEIEYKITADEVLAIKQARSWVFHD